MSEYWHRIRTARREHLCAECGVTIAVGQRHEETRCVVDGEWSGYRLCLSCRGWWEFAFLLAGQMGRTRYLEDEVGVGGLGAFFEDVGQGEIVEVMT